MNNIYVFWWQGIENAPEIIKICYKSLLKNYDINSQKVILIDSTNYKKYVEIPTYIIEKMNNGIISITNFSDIVRSIVLYKNGGLWVDASIFFTKPINKKIFDRDFFIMKNPSSQNLDITSRWSPFLIGGKKGYLLFKFMMDFWLEYWKKENQLITYLLIDHLFYIGYKENNLIRREFEKAEEFYYKVDYFQNLLNTKLDINNYNEIMKNEKFLKLSYKFELKEKLGGYKTYFGKLKEDINEKN